MAQVPTQEEVDKLVEPEQARLEYKRKVTGNPEWEPANGDHGAGIVPEDIWREKNPDSKPETSIPRTLDSRLLSGGEDNG